MSSTPGVLPGDEVVCDQVDPLGDQPGEAAQRDVLGERHRVLLDVHAVRPGLRSAGRVPGSQTIAALRAWSPGPSSTAPTRIGASIAVGGLGDRGGRVRVVRVVGRPAGRCRWSSPARSPGPAAAPGRRRPGAASASVARHVVVEHRPALRVELQAEPRHVALHDRDLDRPARTGVLVGTAKPSGNSTTAPPIAATTAYATHGRRPDRTPLDGSGHHDAPRGQRQQPAGERDANVTSGAPPSAAYRSSGESPWLNASRPHGKPPNGVRSRSAS